MSTTQQKPINIPPRQRSDSLQSADSEQLSTSMSASPPERRFSISQMLGRRISVEDAYKRYSTFTTNGDGFSRENYIKEVDPAKLYGLDEHGNTVEKHNQGYFLP